MGKEIKYDVMQKKRRTRAVFLLHRYLVAVGPWRPLFGPAISAINWPVWSRFKRKLGDFCTALGAFPISFNHFHWAEVSSAIVVFIKHLCIANLY